MKTNAGEQFVGEGFIEQGTVGVGSLDWVAAKREPIGMWCQCGVTALAYVGWAAGPAIHRRVVGQASTYRVEFNIAIAAKDVVRAVQKAGFVAPFPWCAGAPVAATEQRHVRCAQAAASVARSIPLLGRGKQVHMVVHQHMDMQLAAYGV